MEDYGMRSTRRRFFQAMGTGAAGLTLGSKGASSASAATVKATGKEAQDGPVLLVGDDIAVADTRHGKVRGYVLRGIHYFLGE
jgi:para-nitrobenzyl esterase